MKKQFRAALLIAIAITLFSSATILTRGALASPAPAHSKNKSKNKNKNSHTREMKRNQKKLILKGRREKHKEKHT